MYIGHVKKVAFILIRFFTFPTDFQNIYRYQINENPSNRSRVVPCWRTDGQTWRNL